MNTESSMMISTSATARIAHLLRGELPGSRLRVSVAGGGCSGFQYQFDFDAATPAADDLCIEQEGARIVIDATSLEFLKESTLDYVDELGGAFFEIKNPNATASCGCGNSFAV